MAPDFGRRTKIDSGDIAKRIDHTALKAQVGAVQIRELCDQAKLYGFAAVCVNSYRVALAVEALAGTSIPVSSAVGFPLGASTTKVKVAEASQSVGEGAMEIDMVMNIGALMEGDYRAVDEDISSVRRSTDRAILKVIIESTLLESPELISKASRLAVAAGADFVKTSTGLDPSGGATVEHVALIRSVIGQSARIKASGGIRRLADALAMLSAGADRVGTSAGVAIMREVETVIAEGLPGS